MNPADYYDLVSGRRTGIWPALQRAGLRLISWPYGWIVRLRNARYDRHPEWSQSAGVPVISVGNLTLGGTGKTPCVEWLCRALRERGVRVAILSRGYKAEESSYNDEARELEEKLPDVPHLQNPDRNAAARIAVEELASQCLVLDDAFQHRRIARDLDLVLIDADAPDGYGAIFPRGTLREPLSGLSRAHGLILTRADRLTADQIAQLRDRFSRYAPRALWAVTIHAPQALRDDQGNEQSCELLRNARVAAFCGIGNPAAFRRTIEGSGAQLITDGWRTFPDHHHYNRDDFDQLQRWAADLAVDFVLCTHKDLVKLQVSALGGKPLRAIRVGLEFRAGEQELRAALEPLIARIPPDAF